MFHRCCADDTDVPSVLLRAARRLAGPPGRRSADRCV